LLPRPAAGLWSKPPERASLSITPGIEAAMTARIYKPSRTAMQSGQARTKQWQLEYDADRPRTVEPLMGYTSSSDMLSQVRLSFDTKEEAIAYAERHGIAYRVQEPKEKGTKRMSYSDNFKFNRPETWTH
jgi:hypothetical protein